MTNRRAAAAAAAGRCSERGGGARLAPPRLTSLRSVLQQHAGRRLAPRRPRRLLDSGRHD